MTEIELTEETLIGVVLDPEKRSLLFQRIKAEEGTHLPLTNLYHAVASRCQATEEQIRQVIHVLLEAKTDDDLIEPFVFHSHTPNDILFELFELRRCIVALGHRHRPQNLLEKMAATYRYSEAITTLALDYFGTETADDQEFINLVTEYKDDHMLRQNLKRSKKLSKRKRSIALAILKQYNLG